MKPARFDYYVPDSTEEAVSLLAEHGDEARVLAGGQSLVPMMNMRLARPGVLVDINTVGDFSVRKLDDEHVYLGAIVRQGIAMADRELAQHVPLIAAGLAHVGHPQNRARGTIVGSLAHHDPAAELPAVSVALDAQVTAASVRGTRSIPAEEFFVAYYTTALEPDEVATGVCFPAAAPGTGAAFDEFSRRTGDFALVGVAAQLTAHDGRVREARLAFAAMADHPVRARKTEAVLAGQPVTPETVAEAVRLTVEEDGLDPADDIHASASFRLSILPVIAERAITRAWSNATVGAGGRSTNLLGRSPGDG
jgi:aerobic carbon-monoxide dehydrogenase medium subunit